MLISIVDALRKLKYRVISDRVIASLNCILFQYVSIRVIPDQRMLRGGSTAPCAECYFSSIGAVSEQENLGHSQALTDIITQDLKVEKDR